jgi:hypothetical protein
MSVILQSIADNKRLSGISIGLEDLRGVDFSKCMIDNCHIEQLIVSVGSKPPPTFTQDNNKISRLTVDWNGMDIAIYDNHARELTMTVLGNMNKSLLSLDELLFESCRPHPGEHFEFPDKASIDGIFKLKSGITAYYVIHSDTVEIYLRKGYGDDFVSMVYNHSDIPKKITKVAWSKDPKQYKTSRSLKDRVEYMIGSWNAQEEFPNGIPVGVSGL